MQMSNLRRALLALAAIGILIGAFAVLNGSGDDSSGPARTGTGPTGGTTAPAETAEEPGSTKTSPTNPGSTTTEAEPDFQEIEFEDGAPKGGPAQIDATKGERIRFEVQSDVADHVHVHGYDLMKEVGPGKRARFSFVASITGRFEVEMEERAIQIARIEVTP
jgi:hypothetical protein